jgi:diacylglycerol kinase
MRKRLNPSPSGYRPVKKLKVMLKGLYLAAITDFSVAYKLVLSIPILILAYVFSQWIHLTLVLLVTGMMLTAELFNSAIEILCDFMEQQDNVQIGAIKDIAAAATGISILVWGITLIIEGIHFWNLYKN